MILHTARQRPPSWNDLISRVKHRWMIPFFAFEWVSEWVAFGLGNWRFLEVLEYLSSFSVLVAVVFYFSESGDRIKQRHYQAWLVINTSQGKGGSGGRIEALEELNQDRVPLIGVYLSLAYLEGLKLRNARLVRSDLSSADLRDSDLQNADLDEATLESTNFRNADLAGASFEDANLTDIELLGSDLAGAKFDDANLERADLRNADLKDIHWRKIGNIHAANIAHVKNPPDGFVAWALGHGAVHSENAPE